MTKRYIRLKEFGSSLSRLYTPKSDYTAIRNMDNNKTYYLESDDDGFCKNSYIKKAKGEIYILGGSTFENLYCDQSSRIYNFLQKKILINDFDYCVYNGGYSGMTSLLAINVFINKIAKKENSLLYFNLPSNDYKVLKSNDSYWNRSKHFGNIHPEDTLKPLNNKEHIDFDSLGKNLLSIIALCNIFKIKLVIGGVIHSGITLGQNQINTFAKELCLKNDVKFIDFEKKLSLDFFHDEFHLNEKGSEFVASLIFDFFEDHNFFEYTKKNNSFTEIEITYKSNSDEEIDLFLKKGYFFEKDLGIINNYKKIKLENTKGKICKRLIVLQNFGEINPLDFFLGSHSWLSYDINIFNGDNKLRCKLLSFSENKLVFYSGKIYSDNLVSGSDFYELFLDEFLSENNFVYILMGDKRKYLSYRDQAIYLTDEPSFEDGLMFYMMEDKNYGYIKNKMGCNLTVNRKSAGVFNVHHVKALEKILLSVG